MGLRHLECSAGQAAVDPGGERLSIETRVRHAVSSRRLERLPKQPLDRLVPFTRGVHSAVLLTGTIGRGFLAPGANVEYLLQVERTRVLRDTCKALRHLDVCQPAFHP